MKNILAIDPGSDASAIVVFNGNEILYSDKFDNEKTLDELTANIFEYDVKAVYIEMIASYGMPVGKEVFDTCVWIGRFMQQVEIACIIPVKLIYRKDVKSWHCRSTKAKDGNIIQALKDKYGVKGTKKRPGFFYHTKADIWQAFAIAAMIYEKEKEK